MSLEAATIDSRRVRRNFSRRAGDYDRHAVVQKRVADRLLDLILEAGPLDGPVLDVGTGTGRLARSIQARSPGALLLISDLAHGMTAHAASRVPGAWALDADARALAIRSGALAAVVSSSVYQWLGDLESAFCESARVLTPGGRFAFALFGERTLYELRQSHRRAVAEAGGGRPSHAQTFPAAAGVEAALAAAGFEAIRVLVAEEVEQHRDVVAVLESLKRIGAGNAASGRPGGLASRRVIHRMMALYEENFRHPDGLPATYEVIYGLARKPAG